MQGLAQRHEDRARRRATNRAERSAIGGFTPGVTTGAAALAYREFARLVSRLSDKDKEELKLNIEGIEAEFGGGYRSLAEAPDGSGETMAGIGVVNTKVVPASVIATDSDNKGAGHKADAGWGETAPVTAGGKAEPIELDPGANLNGQALNDQLGGEGGWGSTGSPSSADLKSGQTGNGGGTGEGKTGEDEK